MPCVLECTIVILLLASAIIGYVLVWSMIIFVGLFLTSFLVRKHEVYTWYENGLLGDRRPHPCRVMRALRHKQWLAERHYEQNGLP
jgi:hypothetical protein